MLKLPTQRKNHNKTMKIKYLYGKSEFLDPLVNGESGIRFSDLSHYSRLENEKMRDDEMNKIFIPRKEEIIIEINGYRLSKEDMSQDPTICVTPRHCYCLCLSGRENDEKLYRDFKADICIAIDVDELENRIGIVCEKFKGSHVIGREVTYYDQSTLHGLSKSSEDLVFYKPDFFVHEDEYRLAWYYPLNKTGFLAEGITIPFRIEGKSSHIVFFNKEKNFITDCIQHVYRKCG